MAKKKRNRRRPRRCRKLNKRLKTDNANKSTSLDTLATHIDEKFREMSVQVCNINESTGYQRFNIDFENDYLSKYFPTKGKCVKENSVLYQNASTSTISNPNYDQQSEYRKEICQQCSSSKLFKIFNTELFYPSIKWSDTLSDEDSDTIICKSFSMADLEFEKMLSTYGSSHFDLPNQFNSCPSYEWFYKPTVDINENNKVQSNNNISRIQSLVLEPNRRLQHKTSIKQTFNHRRILFEKSGAIFKRSNKYRAPKHSIGKNILNVCSYPRSYKKKIQPLKYHTRYGKKWSVKLLVWCFLLGTHIKQKAGSKRSNSLKQDNFIISNSHKKTVNEYKSDMNKEINDIKMFSMEILNRMSALEKRLEPMENHLEDIVGKLNSLTINSPFIRSSCGPTGPPPPPPPLPPPFSSNISMSSKNPPAKTKIKEKNFTGVSRPVITLDDILKVKLRKTKDKPVVAEEQMLEPSLGSSIISGVNLKPTVTSR